MEIEIREYTLDRLEDVLAFEEDIRKEEEWGWEIDEAYLMAVKKSFQEASFQDSVSLLAYKDQRVVGRIDASMIRSHFDGSTKAYLDWICVVRNQRHQGIAQKLLEELKKRLKERGIDTLIALTSASQEAQNFYRAIPDSRMGDIGIWIDIL